MGPEASITRSVSSWPGVTTRPAAGGGCDLAYGPIAFGRIRAGVIETALPPRVREMVVETGRAEPAADRRWALLRVRSDDDVEPAVELLRLGFERARIALAVRDAHRPSSG